MILGDHADNAGQMVVFFLNGSGGYLLNGINGSLTTFNFGAGTQITSINNERPLIAVFNQQHVVVVSGGSSLRTSA